MTIVETWTTVQNALHAWAVTHSGLGASKVIWAKQDVPRPAYPYVTLMINNAADVEGGGVGEVIETFDEEDDELDVVVRAQRGFTLMCQAFSTKETPQHSAKNYLESMRHALGFPSVKAAFRSAQVGYSRLVSFLDIGGVGSGEYLSRWSMDLIFSTVFVVADASIPYIGGVTEMELTLSPVPTISLDVE